MNRDQEIFYRDGEVLVLGEDRTLGLTRGS